MSEIRHRMLSGLAEKFAAFLDTPEGRAAFDAVGRSGASAISLAFTAGAVACLEILDGEPERPVLHDG